jgi:hypothetical protein
MNSDTIEGSGFPLAFKAGVGKRPAVVRGVRRHVTFTASRRAPWAVTRRKCW